MRHDEQQEADDVAAADDDLKLSKRGGQKSMTMSQSREDDLSNSQSQLASASQKVSKKKLPALKFKDQNVAAQA